MATLSPKMTRKQKQKYLGVVRRPDSHSRTLRRCLEESGGASGSSQQTTSGGTGSVCAQWYPVLAGYKDAFISMKHRGTEIKKRKRKKFLPKEIRKWSSSLLGHQ